MSFLAILLYATVAFGNVEHVRITVVPDHAPDGSLWRVMIGGHELQPDADLVYAGDFGDGDYTFQISKPNGDMWWNRELQISPRHFDIRQPLPPRRVSGTVTIGDQPAAATITFGKPDGEHFTIHSDDSGHFNGEVLGLRDQLWHVSVETGENRFDLGDVEADRDQPFLFRISQSFLRARVVDREGREVPGAVVHAFPKDEPYRDFTTSSGRRLSLIAASYRVRAAMPHADSREADVTLLEGETRDLTLVLDPDINIHGRVLLENGHPVAGTMVFVTDGVGVSRTDSNGEFTLSVQGLATTCEVKRVVGWELLEPVRFVPHDGMEIVLRVRPAEQITTVW